MKPLSLDCKETFRRLDDYVDRELTPDEAEAVVRHLEQCVSCADEFRVEADLIEMLKQKLRHIKAPAGLMRRIVEQLEKDGG